MISTAIAAETECICPRWSVGLDIHPNRADEISGRSNKYVRVTDGDGTTHEFTGTNTGSLSMGGMQMPATGKSVVSKGAYFARVKDGKVVEFSSHPDAAGMMMQLGMMPGA